MAPTAEVGVQLVLAQSPTPRLAQFQTRALGAATDHAANFFQRGRAGQSETEPVLLERDHPGAYGFVLDLLGGLSDQLANFACDWQNFVDRRASVIAAVAAGAATNRVVESGLCIGRQAQHGSLGLVCLGGSTAGVAEQAQQS